MQIGWNCVVLFMSKIAQLCKLAHVMVYAYRLFRCWEFQGLQTCQAYTAEPQCGEVQIWTSNTYFSFRSSNWTTHKLQVQLILVFLFIYYLSYGHPFLSPFGCWWFDKWWLTNQMAVRNSDSLRGSLHKFYHPFIIVVFYVSFFVA